MLLDCEAADGYVLPIINYDKGFKLNKLLWAILSFVP